MKTTPLHIAIFTFVIILFASCIHFKVHNPRKAGSYPKETPKLLLLGQSTKYRTCYDVTHYALNLNVFPETKFISGNVIMKSIAINDIDTFQDDLYENMKLNKILLVNNNQEKELSFKRIEGAIFIGFADKIKKGEMFTLKMIYEGNPIVAKRPPWRGGFVWKKDKNGNPWIGVACETEGSSLWWPCKDDVSDEPDSATVILSVPKNLVAVSNGKLMDVKNEENKSIYHWHISYPINNYNVTIYVGDFKLLSDEYNSASTGQILKLNHYVLPYNYEKAKTHFQQVKAHIRFYEQKFGAYPWYKDGFKLVESPYAGMEHQSGIAYGNGYKNSYGNFDYIILHETAHEWWGNSVSAADLADGWIHEGFASYCEALYVESTQGYSAYKNYLYIQRLTIKNKRPVVRKRNIRYFNYKDSDIYTKGSLILHTLRNIINDDDLFFDILKTFRTENNEKQILSEVFIELVNKKTKQDYTWFFNQYLFKREAPILEYYMDGEGLYYRWTKTNDDFKLPAKIKANKQTILLFPTTKLEKIELKDITIFDSNIDFSYYGTNKNKKLKKLWKASQTRVNF